MKLFKESVRKEKLKIEKILTDIMSPTTMSPTWTWVHLFICYILTLLFVFFFKFSPFYLSSLLYFH